MKNLLFPILIVLTSSCQNSGDVLFSDPLNGTYIKGWNVEPNNFSQLNDSGTYYFLKCDSIRLDTIAPWVGDSSWVNYQIEFEMMITERKGFIGMDYNMQEKSDYGCNFHFATFRDTTKLQSMGMWGNNKGSWKLWPLSQKQFILNLHEWIKIKMEVNNSFANIYVNDTCIYTIYDIPFSSGGIRFWASWYGSAYFRNLKVSKLKTKTIFPVLKDEWEKIRGLNLVKEWHISDLKPDSFAREKLPNSSTLEKEDWSPVKTNDRGVINLSKIYPDYTHNSVLAKTIIESDEAKELKGFFTYTDRFKLYCNNEEIFHGPDRNWWNPEREKYGNSRLIPDQFEVVLPLKAGKNEIIVRSEVMEDFGWGFWMRLEDH